MIGDIDVNSRQKLDREVLKTSHREDEISQRLFTPELQNIRLIIGKTNDLSKIVGYVYTHLGLTNQKAITSQSCSILYLDE